MRDEGMSSEYDIIVVGGGMVGALFACALGGGPLRIAVVEARPASRELPEQFENRVSAITRATERAFRAVGAWDGMVARRVQPYREMEVWDAGGSGRIHFDAADVAEPDLGHIVENGVILGALLDRMEQFGNIDLLCPAEVRRLESLPGRKRLWLADGRALSARLIVGADGSRSWVREQAGIETVGWSYEQSALVATLRTSEYHRDTAWQRFLPTGPLAFLPLPEGYSSIVWSTAPEQAADLMDLDDAAFLDALQHAFGDTLGRMEWVGPRGVHPLGLEHAKAYVADGIALIGNAAHTIHPLAGQGLNLGVLDAAALAEVVAQASARRIGDYRVLRRYERWRKGDNLAVMGAMDGFKRLFSNDNPPLTWLRNTGLQLVDRATPVKRLFASRALGVGEEIPRLARCESLV